MIKLIPHQHLDRGDLIDNLRAGKRYTRANSLNESYAVLHYDKAHIRNPFRYGLKPWDWRGITELKEITESHWYENIPSEGVLCWVTTSDTSHEKPACLIFSYTAKLFIDAGDYGWDTATPVQPKDLYQEPV